MAKLPTGGVAAASVARDREVLEEILDHLKVEHAIELKLTDDHKKQILEWVRLINGNFLQAKDAVEASDVAQIIKSTQSSLDTIITVLSKPEQGLQHFFQADRLEAAFRIAAALKGHKANAPSSPLGDDYAAPLSYLDNDYVAPPSYFDDGNVAPPSYLDDDRIVSLLSLSCTVKDACERALADLQGVRGNSGAPPFEWYDEFVQLLLELARIARIDPVVMTDRNSGERYRRFIELALAFENLLFEDPKKPALRMRSPSRGACAKRLERSLKRLGKA